MTGFTTAPDPGSADEDAARAPRLHLAYPTPATLALPIGRDGLALDKGFFADHGLENARASRKHARLTRKNEAVRIVDEGSRNGTFVNGDKLEGGEAVTLTEGTVVRIGSFVFVYRDGGALVDAPVNVPHTQIAPRAEYRSSFVGPFSLPALVRTIASLARSQSTLRRVLLRGETGTGKETVARWVAATVRPERRFHALNAAELTGDTALSQLFGHVKGAFTGATADRAGAFEAAHGGVLFLDEIGDVPGPIQAALLRAIDPGMIRPVGGTQEKPVDVFVVAASSVLEERVASGAFRRDLFERLTQATVDIPPLRDRREDIGALVRHLLPPGQGADLEPDVVEALMLHTWPGNVRELDRVVGAASRAGGLRKASLPRDVLAPAARASASATRGAVVAAITRLGSVEKAAAWLGMAVTTAKRIRDAGAVGP